MHVIEMHDTPMNWNDESWSLPRAVRIIMWTLVLLIPTTLVVVPMPWWLKITIGAFGLVVFLVASADAGWREARENNFRHVVANVSFHAEVPAKELAKALWQATHTGQGLLADGRAVTVEPAPFGCEVAIDAEPRNILEGTIL